MKRKIVLWLGILFLIMACELPGLNTPTTPTHQAQPTREEFQVIPTLTPACISTQPTQADIDRALNFTGKLFEQGDWKRSYTVTEYRASVTWLSDALSTVVFLEAQIFPCGYEEPTLDNYFNEDYWKVVFENYQGYELTDQCRKDDGTRLYEFTTKSSDVPYVARYWSKNDTDTRIITVMMVSPGEDFAALDEFSYALFPQLQSCK